MSEIEKFSSFESMDEGDLSGHSIDEVNALLDSIIDDDSLGKKARRRAVAHVVTIQPHKTSEFKKYDKHNQVVRNTVNHDMRESSKMVGGIAIMPVLMGSLLAPNLFSSDQFGLSSAIGFAMFCVILAAVLLTLGTVSFRKSSFRHELAYPERESRNLEGFNEWVMDKKKKELEKRKAELDQLSLEITGGDSMISVSGVKKDYAEVLSRIAEYELDIDKALRFPAFNDISVFETKEMIKQLRTCSKLTDEISAHNVEYFSKEVDELWVRFYTAEENAKGIKLSSVTEREIKLFEQAKNLLDHASDRAYSEDVRANYYRKLKSVVDTLNESKRQVPAKIVAQLEAKAAQQIEAA